MSGPRRAARAQRVARRSRARRVPGVREPLVPDTWLLLASLLSMFVVAPFGRAGWNLSGDLVVLVLLAWLPLLLLRRHPGLALAGTTVMESLHLVVVPLLPPLQFTAVPVATLVAAYTYATVRSWRWSWPAGGGAAVLLFLAGWTAGGGGERLAVSMFMVDLVLAATGLGVFARGRHLNLAAMEHRAVQAEQQAQADAQAAVTAERLRIARDIHDVVAHNIALVNAQAGVAQYLLQSDPAAAGRALAGITEHTREALDELRATVQLLRAPATRPTPGSFSNARADAADTAAAADGLVDAEVNRAERAAAHRVVVQPEDESSRRPTPDLTRLPQLVAKFRTSGQVVDVEQTGAVPASWQDVDLAMHVSLAGYRIVQEALTNAGKHAPGDPAHLSLHWTPDHLRIVVSNDTVRARLAQHRGPGTGHGLIGMRERALSAGGSFAHRDDPAGTFTVTADLPRTAHRAPGAPHPVATSPSPTGSSPAGSSSTRE